MKKNKGEFNNPYNEEEYNEIINKLKLQTKKGKQISSFFHKHKHIIEDKESDYCEEVSVLISYEFGFDSVRMLIPMLDHCVVCDEVSLNYNQRTYSDGG